MRTKQQETCGDAKSIIILLIALLPCLMVQADITLYNTNNIFWDYSFEGAVPPDAAPQYVGYWFPPPSIQDGGVEEFKFANIVGNLTQCIDPFMWEGKTLRLQFLAYPNSPSVNQVLKVYAGYTSFEDNFVIDSAPLLTIPEVNEYGYWFFDQKVTFSANTNNKPLICFTFSTTGSGSTFLDDVILTSESNSQGGLISNSGFEEFIFFPGSGYQPVTPFPSNIQNVTNNQWYNSYSASEILAPERNYYGTPSGGDLIQCIAGGSLSGKTVRLQYLDYYLDSSSHTTVKIYQDTELLDSFQPPRMNSDNNIYQQIDLTFTLPLLTSTNPKLCFAFSCIAIDNVQLSVLDPNSCAGVICEDTDSDFCTDYVCEEVGGIGQCVHVEHICDDSKECTTDSCYDNECHYEINCTPSTNCEDVICDDSNIEGGVCTYTSSCIGNLCHVAECVNNQCVRSTHCQDDGDVCTIETCNDNGSCSSAARDCKDDNPCTVDKCSNSRDGCYYEEFDCDDRNVCTVDSCNNTASEGNQCIHTDVICNDNNTCTEDTCNSAIGCMFHDISCADDGDLCTHESCDRDIGCVREDIICDDNNSCTINSCDALKGCYYDEVDCSDGLRCTKDECNPSFPEGQQCVHHPAISCSTKDLCKISTCDEETLECVESTNNCDDGLYCTIDSCISDSGCKHELRDCDDNNPCTSDFCDNANKKCQNVDSACNDNNLCTTDSCSKSGCIFTTIVCNDNNACTADYCSPERGCIFTPISCDDGNKCTSDSCDSSTGCKYTNICSATGCGSVSDCNFGSTSNCDELSCHSGECMQKDTNCNDGNVCTSDHCNHGRCFHLNLCV